MLFSILGVVAMIAPAVVLFIFVRNSYSRIIAILALLYPLGEWLQYMLIGPRWIRWHLSDIGFVPSVGLLFTIVFLYKNPSWDRFPDQVLKGVSFALAMGIAFESLQFFFHGDPEAMSSKATGSWIDMSIFCLTYGLTCYLIHKMRQSEMFLVTRTKTGAQ